MRPLRRDLDLGPAVVRLMLPHRPPLLLVDRVVGLRLGQEPCIAAERQIRAGEPVFAGHFPGLPLWPGVYTIEALAQTSLLLFRALELGDPAETLSGLTGLASALCADNAAEHPMRARLATARGAGLMSAVDVKLLAPVFAGATLGLEASLLGGWGDGWRVRVRASAARRTIAEGTLGLALRQTEG